jgi:glycosyltransferase involved in cell wall biosynthesis
MKPTSNNARREYRVLHVFDSLGTGGAEVWLLAMLRYFSEVPDRDYLMKTEVLLTSGRRSVFDDEAEGLGAKLHYSVFSVRRMLQFRRDLRRILRGNRFDAIHDHQGIVSGIHFVLAGPALPPVRVAHFHNPRSDLLDAGRGLKARLRERFGTHATTRLSTHLLGTSEACLREYGFEPHAARSASVRAVHCGFDTGLFASDSRRDRETLREEFNWPSDARVMLFVGRLGADNPTSTGGQENRKNPRFALEVAREVIQSQPGARLLMVGGGEGKRCEYMDLVRQWGMTDHIAFAGLRSDVPAIMSASDLLLFTSTAEGLGMVAVEAQTAGLPVLASSAVPHECVVIDSLVTFLPLEIGPLAWAREAIAIMMRPRLGADVSRELVAASAFSIDHSAEALVEIYGSDRA